MPKNDIWDQLAEQGRIEVEFEDSSGTLLTLDWSDIASKRITLDPPRCELVLRELASSTPRYSSRDYLATNRVVTVSPDTMRSIYKQARHPISELMEKRLTEVATAQAEAEAEAARKRAEHEARADEPLKPRHGPRPGY